MKPHLFAGLVLTFFSTLSAAQTKFKDDPDSCKNLFVATVTTVQNNDVSVRFNSGLTRALSQQEKEARGPITVGDSLCLQDDVE